MIERAHTRRRHAETGKFNNLKQGYGQIAVPDRHDTAAREHRTQRKKIEREFHNRLLGFALGIAKQPELAGVALRLRQSEMPERDASQFGLFGDTESET